MGQAAGVDADLRVTPGDAIEEHPCECCGRPIRSGRGEVVSGGEVAALYWFDLHRKGDDRGVRLLVTMDRVSFVVEGRTDQDGIAFALRGPRHGPVIPRPEVNGRTLGRRRALRHKQLPDLWRVVDALVDKDPVVAEHVG
jgi:hypothetical protein